MLMARSWGITSRPVLFAAERFQRASNVSGSADASGERRVVVVRVGSRMNQRATERTGPLSCIAHHRPSGAHTVRQSWLITTRPSADSCCSAIDREVRSSTPAADVAPQRQTLAADCRRLADRSCRSVGVQQPATIQHVEGWAGRRALLHRLGRLQRIQRPVVFGLLLMGTSFRSKLDIDTAPLHPRIVNAPAGSKRAKQ